MPYTPQHTERVRTGGPVATPFLLAAALTSGSAATAYVQTRDASAAPQSAAGLLAERARAAALTSSRTAHRASLAHPLPSTSPYRTIDPTSTPVLDASLTNVTKTDTRRTARLRARLAEAVEEMGHTGRAYAAAAARAGSESLEMSRTQSRLLAHRAGSSAQPGGVSDADSSLAAARTDELRAADAHRAAIAHVITLRGKVLAAARSDVAAARQREDAAIAAGVLIRLPDGSTRSTPALGTPIKGNGWTMTAPVRGWIAQALTTLYANGYPAHEDDAIHLATIIYNESSGNPSVQNLYDRNARAGIPSFGLMQTIGPTFKTCALPGYTDVADPIHQIMAGARYARQTYGSLADVPGVRSLAAGGSYQPY